MDAASHLSGEGLIDSLRKQASLPGSGRLQDDFTLVVLCDSVQTAPVSWASEAGVNAYAFIPNSRL